MIAIDTPFGQHFDLSGSPLQSGSLYFGVAGQNPVTSPVAIYWDAAGTQPAAQPVRTLNGYPMNNGTPAIVYVAGAYSMLVRDKKGQQVFFISDSTYLPASAAALLQTTLLGTSGAGMIGTSKSGVTVQEAMDELRTLRGSAGCAGDGVTDDYTKLLAAGNTEVRHDGNNLTYKCNSALSFVGKAVKFHNCAIDFSGIAAPYGSEAPGLTIAGTKGAPVALTADAAAGALTCSVASGATFQKNSYALFESTRIWEGSTPITFIVLIRDVSGTTITFAEQNPYVMNVADGATLAPLAMQDGVELVNVKLIGLHSDTIFNSGNQSLAGAKLSYCANPRIDRLCGKDLNYATLFLDRCANVEVVSPSFDTAKSLGLSYGVGVINGCYNIRGRGGHARDMRHGWSIGGTGGVNRKVSVIGLIGDDMLDAIVDAHPAVDDLLVAYCMTTTSGLADGTAGRVGDGLICQGANYQTIGNVINNPLRHGIFHQVSAIGGGTSSHVGNTIRRHNSVASPTSTVAVNITNEGAGALDCVSVSGLVLEGQGDFGIAVDAVSSNISSVTIAPCEASQFTAAINALRVRARSGRTVAKPRVMGGSYKCSGSRVVQFLCDAGGTMSDADANGVTADGAGAATVAISMTNVTRGRIVDNVPLNYSGTAPFETTSSTGIYAPDIANNAQTISSGAIALTNSGCRIVTVDTEGGAASDVLDTITGGVPGQIVVVVAASSARTVQLAEGGNLRMSGATFDLNNAEDTAMFQLDAGGTFWRMLSGLDNGA